MARGESGLKTMSIKTLSQLSLPMAMLLVISSRASAGIVEQWWDISNTATWVPLSQAYGVTPPGFLDDKMQAPFTQLTSDPSIRNAMEVGGFFVAAKPTRQRLEASLKIIDAAQEKGPGSLLHSMMRVQILAVLERTPFPETDLLVQRYKKKKTPYTAFEIAYCEFWERSRSKDRRLRANSLEPMWDYSNWQPVGKRERFVHSLVSFASGVTLGTPSISALEAAEELDCPGALELIAFRYRSGTRDFKSGKFIPYGERMPFPLKAPSDHSMVKILAAASDRHPSRPRLALYAHWYAEELSMHSVALKYAKRYLSCAPTWFQSRKWVAEYVKKHEN